MAADLGAFTTGDDLDPYAAARSIMTDANTDPTQRVISLNQALGPQALTPWQKIGQGVAPMLAGIGGVIGSYHPGDGGAGARTGIAAAQNAGAINQNYNANLLAQQQASRQGLMTQLMGQLGKERQTQLAQKIAELTADSTQRQPIRPGMPTAGQIGAPPPPMSPMASPSPGGQPGTAPPLPPSRGPEPMQSPQGTVVSPPMGAQPPPAAPQMAPPQPQPGTYRMPDQFGGVSVPDPLAQAAEPGTDTDAARLAERKRQRVEKMIEVKRLYGNQMSPEWNKAHADDLAGARDDYKNDQWVQQMAERRKANDSYSAKQWETIDGQMSDATRLKGTVQTAKRVLDIMQQSGVEPNALANQKVKLQSIAQGLGIDLPGVIKYFNLDPKKIGIGGEISANEVFNKLGTELVSQGLRADAGSHGGGRILNGMLKNQQATSPNQGLQMATNKALLNQLEHAADTDLGVHHLALRSMNSTASGVLDHRFAAAKAAYIAERAKNAPMAVTDALEPAAKPTSAASGAAQSQGTPRVGAKITNPKTGHVMTWDGKGFVDGGPVDKTYPSDGMIGLP